MLPIQVKGSQRQPKAVKGSQRQSKTQRQPKPAKGSQRQSKAVKGRRRQSKAGKDSKAAKGSQRQSKAVRGSQRQSKTIISRMFRGRTPETSFERIGTVCAAISRSACVHGKLRVTALLVELYDEYVRSTFEQMSQC